MPVSNFIRHATPRFAPAALLLFNLLGSLGCTEAMTTPEVADMAVALPPDMALPPACAQQGWAPRPFATGTTGILRDSLAADFTLTDQNGAWNLKANWSGCESYVFIPDGMPASSVDSTPLWSADLDALIAGSPPNVHYFFVSKKFDAGAAKASVAMVSAQLDGALGGVSPGSAPGQIDWWKQHLHFVQGGARDIQGWLGDLLGRSSTPEGFGFAIDPFQRLRGLGSFADVARFDAALQAKGQWPYASNLAYAANPPVYFNYEVSRQAAIEAEKNPTVITVYNHVIVQAPTAPDSGVPDGGIAPQPGTVYKDVTFPDAATMKGFDTLEVDLTMNCPMSAIPEEANNCGAWDYLVNLYFLDPDGKTWNEAARFISSYHRAGRFFVDASHFLPYLAKGGTFHMQYTWAPPWNEQPKDTVMQFRLLKNGKGLRPTQSSYLFSGGGFDPNYNVGRMPVSVMIPPTAKKVELHAIITGHGADTKATCAEFCSHQHVFTVGGMPFKKDFSDTIGDNEGCLKQIGKGAVPNQSGTWWYGRGGWCPGMQVDPWVVDVTAVAQPGKTVVVSYQGLFNGKPPNVGLGNIVMNSWLVVWE